MECLCGLIGPEKPLFWLSNQRIVMHKLSIVPRKPSTQWHLLAVDIFPLMLSSRVSGHTLLGNNVSQIADVVLRKLTF
jgi:hypothetical protein